MRGGLHSKFAGKCASQWQSLWHLDIGWTQSCFESVLKFSVKCQCAPRLQVHWTSPHTAGDTPTLVHGSKALRLVWQKWSGQKHVFPGNVTSSIGESNWRSHTFRSNSDQWDNPSYYPTETKYSANLKKCLWPKLWVGTYSLDATCLL